jgi:hypothetical protein
VNDRPRRCRLRCLVSAFLGFVAGFTARSELQRRLNRGRRLLPDDPHPYAPEASWPGTCWCSRPKDAPVHQSRLSAPAGSKR